MGQLLMVIGSDPVSTERIFHRGVTCLSACFGSTWSAASPHLGMRLALWPPLHATGTGIVRSDDSTFSAAVGAPFFNGQTRVAGLCLLARSAANNSDLRASLNGTEGVFAIAGGGRDFTYVITDRLGSLHIYRTDILGCVVLCTSSLALAAVGDTEWDVEACREFLCTGTVFAHRSLFKRITKLPPATVLRWAAGREESFVYWSIADSARGLGATGTVAEMASVLTRAMASISANVKRPVLDLTGGFDSRVVFGAMLHTHAPFECVVNGPDNDADVVISRRIAAQFGIPHHHQRTREGVNTEDWWNYAQEAVTLCDGEFNALLYANTLNAHRRLASRFGGSVNGSNGELCKGYWWELLFPFTGRRDHFDERLIARKRFAVDTTLESALDHHFQDSLCDHFAGIIDHANLGFDDLPNTAKLDNVYLTLRMQRWQGRILSATSRLWSCASPFMFREVMEIALSTPPRQRLRNRMSRRLIEHLSPALARLPLAQGYPALPIRLSNAHLFTPLAAELGARVIRKCRQMVFPQRSGRIEKSVWLPDFDGFRSAIDPTQMLTLPLYKANTLRQIVETHGEYAGRVATLELVARAVRTARLAPVAVAELFTDGYVSSRE